MSRDPRASMAGQSAGKLRHIVLASASPRRRTILQHLGISVVVRPARIKETVQEGEHARQHALRVAEEKARFIAESVDEGLIVGADTVVSIDGETLGKPEDKAGIRRMLGKLSGRTHSVFTGLSIIRNPENRIASGVDETLVEFAPLRPEELDWYGSSGEPDDKAGGYALQGLAALFVTRITGSPSNVIGLPVSLLYSLAGRVGVDLKRLCTAQRARTTEER